LLLLATLFGLVRLQCTLYFDDCYGCLTDPECGWCNSYCIPRDTVCDTGATVLSLSSCPSDDHPVTQKHIRQFIPTCTSNDCNDCIAPDSGCIWCQITTLMGEVLTAMCISNSSAALCSNVYSSPDTLEIISNECPAADGVQNTLFSLVFQGTYLDVVAVRTAIATSLDSWLSAHGRGIALAYTDVVITAESPDPSTTSNNTRVTFYVMTTNPTTESQEQLDADVQAWLDSLVLGEQLPGGIIVVGKGNAQSPPKGGHSLSGGAVAGIVIGVIAGTVLILGTVYFLVKNRRPRLVSPFRAAAASPP